MVNHELPSGKRCAGVRRLGSLLAITLTLAIPAGCTNQSSPSSPQPDQADATASSPATVDTSPKSPLTAAVNTFCGACHAVPSPSSFPRDAWYEEVQRGYKFYFDSGRTDLVIPIQTQVVAWFQSQAPEKLPAADVAAQKSPILFEPAEFTPDPGADAGFPGVSFLHHSNSGQHSIWFSDMLRGRVCEISAAGEILFELRAVAANPAALRLVDLDQNGSEDLVIADLGSPLPADHDRGQVLWIPNFRTQPKPRPVVLLDGVGRVADVRPADFDADGDLDLVVAEFGWHTTGGLHILWNNGPAENGPHNWSSERIDTRPGGIHVPVTDLDNDGRPDFIALVSQEHETVDVFLNKPDGFQRQSLFAAPDPSWGSSGIEIVDFDRDGDSDLLYTAGDTFDSQVIKPFHGIWLLLNTGNLKFEARLIAAMPGVHRALAGDFDQDGDFDIAAAAILPKQAVKGLEPENLQALIWLEQQPDGSFSRYLLQNGIPEHPAMAIADLNNDQRPDILCGVMAESGNAGTPSIKVFLNRGPDHHE